MRWSSGRTPGGDRFFTTQHHGCIANVLAGNPGLSAWQVFDRAGGEVGGDERTARSAKVAAAAELRRTCGRGR